MNMVSKVDAGNGFIVPSLRIDAFYIHFVHDFFLFFTLVFLFPVFLSAIPLIFQL